MSYFLVFEEEADDLDGSVELEALAKAQKKLANIAEEIGVTPLRAFVFGDDRGREDFNDIAENEGWGDYQSGGAGEEWFDANDALDTVRALMGYVESDPESLKRPRATLEQLRNLETALVNAAQAGVRFRLELDE
jgi:hypothetical protein